MKGRNWIRAAGGRGDAADCQVRNTIEEKEHQRALQFESAAKKQTLFRQAFGRYWTEFLRQTRLGATRDLHPGDGGGKILVYVCNLRGLRPRLEHVNERGRIHMACCVRQHT